MLFRFILIGLLIACFALPATAQRGNYLDIVRTHTGRSYEGKIIRYESDAYLTIRLRSGEEVTIGLEEVKRIGFTPISRNEKIEQVTVKEPAPVEEIVERDWFFTPSISASFGRERVSEFDNRAVIGYSLATLINRRLINNLSVGLGLDYTVFNQDRSERVIAVLSQARGGFGKGNVRWFGQFQVGYGLPIGGANLKIDEREGGLMLHPSFGVQFPARYDQPEITIDLGYRFLNTEYSFESVRGVETRSNVYRRLFVRMNTSF